MTVSKKEKRYLRDLAKKQVEYANLPIMEERRRRWYEHNALRGERPMLVMETNSFRDSIIPTLKCQSPVAKEIENQLLMNIFNHELIDDDKVIPNYYCVFWDIKFSLFGLNIARHVADDGLGYNWNYPVSNISTDLNKLGHSTQSVDKEKTFSYKELIENTIGDILPVRLENRSLRWFFTPTKALVFLMGMEYMLMTMIDQPDKFNQLLNRICKEMINHLRWQEEEGLLTLNNENHYIGSGSYGFTDQLPASDICDSQKVKSRDLWGNINSQESVGINPEMFGKMIFPYHKRLSEEFGLIYYGCCEPVHDIWDDYVSKLTNLRKVSISPWCDEITMGEKLSNKQVIYSRKPSPNFIGVDSFDEEGYRSHITATLEAAKGCKLEIIHRDIYTLNGDSTRAKRAISIARSLIDKYYD